MALSTKTMRGAIRYLPGGRKLAAVGRLIVYPETTAPVYGSHIRPTSAPSGTAAKGDFYLGTDGVLYVHDGTAFRAQISSGYNVATVKTAAATLTAAESGAYCFFNSAAGDIYTLPTAAAGLRFHFVVLTTITSNAAKVITAGASEFLLGGFEQSTDGTYTTAIHAANGTNIRAWSGNGTTTGGLAQDWFTVVGLSATQWAIWGHGRATGSEATPFATS